MRSPTKFATLVAIAAAGFTALGAARHNPTTEIASSCLGPDKFSADQIESIKELMHASDSTYIKFRRRVSLPLVADSAITLVTDSSACAAALATWHAQDTGYVPFTSLYVVRVGSVYDTVIPSGSEWNQHMVLDSAFRRAAVYLY